MIVPALGALALSQSGPGLAAQLPPGALRTGPGIGVLLVTGDAKEGARARKADIERDTDLARLFPAVRYETVLWNERYRVVIDRNTGPLERIADRVALARAFAKSPNGSGTLNLSQMAPETYRAAKALARDWPKDSQTLREIEPTALGIDVDWQVVLRSGGQSRTFTYRAPDSRQEAMRDVLRQAVLAGPPSGGSGPSAEERAGTPAPRDEYDFVFTGVTARDQTDGLRLAVEAIAKIETRMRRESDEAIRGLLGSLSYRLDPDSSGSKGIAEMSRAMRDQIRSQLHVGWQEMGFGSQAEGLAYLDAASAFEVRTTVDLLQTVNPGDPSRMMGGGGVAWRIQELPGLYLP